MKRGRSVEPVRLRRRTGSAHGPLARAEGTEIPGREDRRGLAGKFSCQRSSQLDGHQNRSAEVTARLSGGGRLCKRALFALDGKGVIFWSYCSPMARRGGPRSRILRASLGRRRQPAAPACCDRRGGAVPGGIADRRRRSHPAPAQAGVRAFPRAPDRGAGQAFRSDAHQAVAMEGSAEAPGTVVGVVEDGYTINAACWGGPRRAKARPNAASPSIAPEPQGETKVNEWQT